jgi:hypothetical protein
MKLAILWQCTGNNGSNEAGSGGRGVHFEMKADQRLIMVLALWFLWNKRNAIREEGRWRSAECIVRGVRIYAKEMWIWALRRVCPRWRTEDGAALGEASTGTLKLNCDACFSPEQRSGSCGFLLRDSDGDVVLSGRGKINHLLSAF